MIAAATDWFGQPQRALIALGPLLIGTASAALAMRAVERLRLSGGAVYAVLVAGMIVTGLAWIRLLVFPGLAPGDFSWLAAFGDIGSLTAEQPHALLGMLLMSVWVWIIGLGIARSAGDHEERARAFVLYFMLLLVAVVIGSWAAVGGVVAGTQLALALPAYLILGLSTLALVRLAEARARMQATGGGDRRAQAIWRLTSLGMALLAPLVGFIGAALFYSDAYAGPLAFLGAVWYTLTGWLTDILYIVLGPIIGFLGNLILGWLSSGGVTRQGVCPTPTPGLTSPPAGATPVPVPTPLACGPRSIALPKITTPPFSLAALHQFFSTGLIVALVVIGLIMLTRRFRAARRPDDDDETREAVSWKQVLRERFARRPATAATPDVPSNGTVRAAYREWLRATAQVGVARQDAETPTEYARRLRPTVTPENAALGDLTTAYEAERYAAQPATPERFARARAAARAIIARLTGLR